jgi:uncharacterized membrane protein
VPCPEHRPARHRPRINVPNARGQCTTAPPSKERGNILENWRSWIELSSRAIEFLAVALMVGLIAVGTTKWLFFSARGIEKAYERYRVVIGKSLLIGLELLVAADIIRTVALDATLINLASLAVLVLVRTFLGWTLTVEVEGHWPWQAAKSVGISDIEGASSLVSERRK